VCAEYRLNRHINNNRNLRIDEKGFRGRDDIAGELAVPPSTLIGGLVVPPSTLVEELAVPP